MAFRSIRLASRFTTLFRIGQPTMLLIRQSSILAANKWTPVSSKKAVLNQVLCSTATNGPKFEIINAQDDAQFKELVLDSKDTVVVDFHATWCGPCKLLAPRLEKMMETADKPLKLVKVDIDNEELQNMVERYRISAVPTVIGVRNGTKVNEFKGLLEEDRIGDFIKQLTD